MQLDMGQSNLYCRIWSSSSSVIHACVTLCSSTSDCHFLVYVNLLQQNEALLLRQARASSTQTYQGEYLIISDNRSNFTFVLILNIPTQEKAFNYMFEIFLIHLFIGNLLSKFNNHFSPDKFQNLVNSKTSFCSFHSLD